MPNIPDSEPRVVSAYGKYAFILLAFAAATSLQAQTATPAPGPSSKESPGEVISLDAFEVKSSRDLGYTATSSMAGGRIDTPLKETPAVVSIMTAEFLDDIAASNFTAAAEWAPNSIPIGETNNFGDFNVSVRGIGASYPTRNYFRWYMTSDNYNTERLEFARGPNSILFGDGNPGGIATTWTKQALFAQRSSVQFRIDSYGGYRVSADYNQPVSDKLAFRINAVNDRLEGWRDGDEPRRDGGHITTTFRLSQRTQIRAEYEQGLQRRYVFSQNYRDQSSNWNGTTSYNGVTAPPTAGTGVARMNATATNDYLVYLPSTGVLNWRGFFQSTGTNLVMLPEGRAIARFPELPSREFSIQAPDGYIDTKYKTWSMFLEHQFSPGLIAQFAYNYQEQMRAGLNMVYQDRRVDVNTVLPGGIANPNFGKVYSEATPTRQRQGNQLDDWRLSLAYRKNFKWFRESLSFMSGYRTDNYSQRQWRPGRTNGANPSIINASNALVVRQYWDQPTSPALLDSMLSNGFNIDWVNNAYAEEDQSIQYNQLASSTSLFDNRLSVILGYRYDFYDREQQRRVAANVDGSSIVGATGGPGTYDITKFEVDTKTAGFVYFPVQWLGVFGNYSESFSAAGNGAPKLDGTLIPPAFNEGIDVGFKMEFFDGKISGSISYYQTEQTDRARTGDNRTQINDIWTAMGLTDRVIPDFRDTDTYKAHGYELDLTANLTENWRLMLNYSLPETEQIDIGAGLRGYFADNAAGWRAAAASSLPEAAAIASNIATIERTIQGYEEGRALDRTFDYTANIYTTYSFKKGFLKGVGVGGGANFRGKSVIGNTPTSAFDYLYSKAYEIYTAHLSYERRLTKKVRARFQLNVANLFDNQDVRYITYSRSGGIDYPNTFTYTPPRRYTLTTTFSF